MAKNNNIKFWVIVIIVALVAGILGAVISNGITGNVIKQSNNPIGKYNIYTKAEVDNMMKNSLSVDNIATMFSNCRIISANSPIKEGTTCSSLCRTDPYGGPDSFCVHAHKTDVDKKLGREYTRTWECSAQGSYQPQNTDSVVLLECMCCAK